ncbi:hypothetical protein ACFY8C_16355 [Streptomyces flavochromogenes]|uniref:Uncharacterized protein n=1 Tax=Streptomyces flavochromogenes TaxID=68199 RepID=A0ABW6XR74_9ACTN|nr:hypothetical protein [Streptomyces flavochromogenes]
MMRTATSRAARGIAAAMLTALATAGAFTAVAGSVTPASGDAVAAAGDCLDPQNVCWVNGWQEKPGT